MIYDIITHSHSGLSSVQDWLYWALNNVPGSLLWKSHVGQPLARGPLWSAVWIIRVQDHGFMKNPWPGQMFPPGLWDTCLSAAGRGWDRRPGIWGVTHWRSGKRLCLAARSQQFKPMAIYLFGWAPRPPTIKSLLQLMMVSLKNLWRKVSFLSSSNLQRQHF